MCFFSFHFHFFIFFTEQTNKIQSSLYEWLKLLNMDCYHQGLCQQGYTTIDHVLQLTWEDLEDVGINKLGTFIFLILNK